MKKLIILLVFFINAVVAFSQENTIMPYIFKNQGAEVIFPTKPICTIRIDSMSGLELTTYECEKNDLSYLLITTPEVLPNRINFRERLAIKKYLSYMATYNSSEFRTSIKQVRYKGEKAFKMFMQEKEDEDGKDYDDSEDICLVMYCVLKNQRMYMIGVVGTKADFKNGAADAFFDSLHWKNEDLAQR